MTRLALLIFLFLGITVGESNGQKKVLYFHQLTSAEGLSQSNNAFLYTAKNGFTWVSALDGLNLFDGEKVKVFKANPNDSLSIQGANIQSNFFEDQKGNIWFTTSEAINSYQKDKGHFIHDYIEVPNHPDKGVHYAFYLEKNKFLWIAKNHQLHKYNISSQDSIKQTLIADDFQAIRCAVNVDTTGNVKNILGGFWTLKPGIEVITFEKKTNITRKVWFDTPQNKFNTPLTIAQILTEKNNTAWLRTNKGLVYFDISSPKNSILIPPRNENQTIISISFHSKNYLWVVFNNSEVALFDKKTHQYLPQEIDFFNLDENSKINNISSIFPTTDSILWISSTGNGVYFSNLANQRFTSLFRNYALEESPIDRIYEYDNGNILCTSNKGQSWIFDHKKNLIKKEKIPLFLKQITTSNGDIWNISVNGLSKYNPVTNQFIIKATPQAGEWLLDFVDWNDQFSIIAMNKGIVFFDKKKLAFLPPADHHFTVKLFVDSQGRLWSGKTSTELAVRNIIKSNDAIPRLDSIKTFPNLGTILHITEDQSRGQILVGTSKGLVKINASSLTQSHITEGDGLPNQYIHAIALDKKNRIWLSTNKGIIQYIPELSSKKQFRQFTKRDGLSNNEYLHSSVLVAQNGEVWVGGTKGVDVFNPDEIRQIGQTPKFAISNLLIHDKKWKGKSAIGVTQKIQLDYTQNTLKFELAALEYTDPQRNQFKVYLVNDDKIDSTFLGTENSITYANLSPGQYIFKFLAGNAEGIWQSNTHDLAITIHPPYYETTEFRIIATLFLIGLISFISTLYYRYQLREKQLQLEKQEREADRVQLELEKKLTLQMERTRIAGEMHDEIGSGLSTIRNASAKASRKNNFEDIKKIVDRVSQISIHLINNMRGIIWAMDPDFDSLEDLTAYIRRYSVEYLDDNSLAAQITIPEDLPDISMNGKSRHNITLAVKEILHNIVKHANATLVNFEIKVNHSLEIIIKDNGVGFNMDRLEKRGHGLRNITKRMETIHGNVTWGKNIPKGTIVHLNIPLDKNMS